MNAKGVFCFLIIVVFMSMSAANADSENRTRKDLLQAKTVSLEAEAVNSARTNLENNADFIVARVLEKELLSGLNDPNAIKQHVNRKLMDLFDKFSEESSLKIVFYSETSRQGPAPLTEGFLNENTKVVVEKIGNAVFAQYIFTGGLLKNNSAAGVISSKSFSQEFRLPVGYTIEAVILDAE